MTALHNYPAFPVLLIDPLLSLQCLTLSCFLGALICLWQYPGYRDLRLLHCASLLVVGCASGAGGILYLQSTAPAAMATVLLGMTLAGILVRRAAGSARSRSDGCTHSTRVERLAATRRLTAPIRVTSDYSRF